VRGNIAIPYLRDLQPGESIDYDDGTWPAVGTVIRARTQYVGHQGRHHLTARHSDF